ncbi:DUF4222 domain-containing protein [Escherichia coli]|nr:DUF4222 domain-containing protein [Escherichia coli]EHZ9104833.1 DUF4222 domain-containing protein [Escherichia coli]EHZ9219447.1 DUF4222 domain-containing protein [Escherichia coli]
MKKKNSGFTASGLSRPEIRLGDIYRDTRRGGRVVIRHVTPGNITYRREAYEYDCVMPVYQFRRDFSLIQATPRKQPTNNAKARANIQKMKNMINAFRGKK